MASFLSGIPMKPPDSLFGVNKACNEDPAKRKINVTVGAYRDDNGDTLVLQAVRIAEERIYDQNLNHGTLATFLIQVTLIWVGRISSP